MTQLKVRVNGQWKWVQKGLTPLASYPGVSLQPIDGGPSFYANKGLNVAAAVLDDPDFFPICVWFESVLSQNDIDLDKDTGINTYLALTNNSDIGLIRTNGMYAITAEPFPGHGQETIGYLLSDEPDMNYPSDWSPGGGFTHQQSRVDALPQNDGRMLYSNYGKGVLLPTWSRPAGTNVYLNNFQHTMSVDLYWYTDQDIWGSPSSPYNQGAQFYDMFSRNLTKNEAQRAAHYGSVVQFVRDFVTPYRWEPIWGFVENGGPFPSNTIQADYITPEVMSASVWHMVIAGARGIVYFNHTFGGPYQSQHNFRSPDYSAIQVAAKTVNEHIQNLAAVLNDNFAVNFATVSQTPSMLGGINHMVKYHAGKFYIFAGSRADGSSSLSPTFTIPASAGTTATVLFENRAIPIVAGQFTDTFADGNAIHIYRID